MKYCINEVEEDGNHSVDIPEGWVPLFASRGIGRWKIVCLEPTEDVETELISAPTDIEEMAAPEVYVSRKDRAARTKEIVALGAELGNH